MWKPTIFIIKCLLLSTVAFTADQNSIKNSKENLRFRNLGELKLNQGHAHLVVEVSVLQPVLAADKALAYVNRQARRAKVNKRGSAAVLRAIHSRMRGDGKAMTNICASLGMSELLEQARATKVDPLVVDFERELKHRLPEHLLPDPAKEYHPRMRRNATDFVTHSNTDSQENLRTLDHREKRFITLLFGLGIIASAAVGIYNTFQIADIKYQLKKAANERSIVAHAVKELGIRTDVLLNKLSQLGNTLKTEIEDSQVITNAQILADESGRLMQHLDTVVDMALLKRMDVTLVDPDGWEDHMHALKEAAKEKGMELTVDKPWDIVRLSAAIAVEWSGKLNVIVPIPMFSPRFVFQLWEFAQLPIYTPQGWFQINIKNPFLATASLPANTFTTLTREQFSQCFPVADSISCPNLPQILKQNTEVEGTHEGRCLFALFNQDDTSIHEYCALEPVPKTEDSIPLGNNEFAVFSNLEDRITIQCMDGSFMAEKTEPGISVITLKSGCYAETNSVIVHPLIDVSVNTTAADRAFPLTDSLQDLKNATNETLSRIRLVHASIKEQFGEAPNLHWVNAYADKIDKGLTQSIGMNAISTIVIIAVILVVLLLLFCLYRRCTNKNPGTPGQTGTGTQININQPSAPPANQTIPYSNPSYNHAAGTHAPMYPPFSQEQSISLGPQSIDLNPTKARLG